MTIRSPGLEALRDLDPVAHSPSGLDLPGLEYPIALIDKDGLFEPGIENRVHRDGHVPEAE